MLNTPQTETGKQTAVRARKYLVSLKIGFQEITPEVKDEIKSRLHISGGAYDLIKLPQHRVDQPLRRIDLTAKDFDELTLVELKASNRPLPKSLQGHFFSLQYAEQLTAQALGDRYVFAFVVVQNSQPSFYRLLRWQDIWANAKTLHMQWSIRLSAVPPTIPEN